MLVNFRMKECFVFVQNPNYGLGRKCCPVLPGMNNRSVPGTIGHQRVKRNRMTVGHIVKHSIDELNFLSFVFPCICAIAQSELELITNSTY